jgi:L-threonylcarbamoyladenylate synthase
MEEDLKKALETLRKGGLILYPTDTIWGLGCDATRPEAVERIFNLKQRPANHSMLVLIDSPDYLPHYVTQVPDPAYDLIEYAVKPLTIIYSGAKNVAPNLIAPDGTLGIRVTREAFSSQLCRLLKRPIVSTSANLSGQPAPANFLEISDEIRRGVDHIVQYRQHDATRLQASSILRLDANGTIQIIRK